jgi:hypothetical protein
MPGTPRRLRRSKRRISSLSLISIPRAVPVVKKEEVKDEGDEEAVNQASLKRAKIIEEATCPMCTEPLLGKVTVLLCKDHVACFTCANKLAHTADFESNIFPVYTNMRFKRLPPKCPVCRVSCSFHAQEHFPCFHGVQAPPLLLRQLVGEDVKKIKCPNEGCKCEGSPEVISSHVMSNDCEHTPVKCPNCDEWCSGQAGYEEHYMKDCQEVVMGTTCECLDMINPLGDQDSPRKWRGTLDQAHQHWETHIDISNATATLNNVSDFAPTTITPMPKEEEAKYSRKVTIVSEIIQSMFCHPYVFSNPNMALENFDAVMKAFKGVDLTTDDPKKLDEIINILDNVTTVRDLNDNQRGCMPTIPSYPSPEYGPEDVEDAVPYRPAMNDLVI